MFRFTLRLVQLGTLLLLGVMASFAAEPTQATTAEDGYRIGPGDKILVSVAGLQDFDLEAYVSNSGRVHIPRLGIVSVVGETTASLATRLEAEMIDEGILKNPAVRVAILEYRSQPVYVMGEVMMPGQYIITDKMYLSDLIGMANGLAETAGTVGYFYRRTSAGSGEDGSAAPADDVASFVDQVTVIDLDSLYSDPSVNVQLKGGDMLYIPIPEVHYFYVIGDVMQPGRFRMPTEGPLYGVRALSMAGGHAKTAKLGESILVSRAPDGSVTFRDIHMREVLDGRAEDFIVQPGEILFVPGSAARTLGYGLLNALPGVRIF